MTGIPDELATTAANEVFSLSLEQTLNLHIEDCEAITRVVLEAVGLPALLERVEASEGHRDIALGELANRLEQLGEARADRDALAAKVARVEALIELNGGAFLKSDTKIKRVQEDRRRDLGAVVTTSMVTVADVRAALTEGTEG